jgi:hypothetical protein
MKAHEFFHAHSGPERTSGFGQARTHRGRMARQGYDLQFTRYDEPGWL